jgi:hypothetical protein
MTTTLFVCAKDDWLKYLHTNMVHEVLIDK